MIELLAQVKYFNVTKGYGHLTDDSGDYFLHTSIVEASGFNSADLRPGMLATFTMEATQKGRQVLQIIRLFAEVISTRQAVEATAPAPATLPKKQQRLDLGSTAVGRVLPFDHTKGFCFLEVVGRENELGNYFVHLKSVRVSCRDHIKVGELFDFSVDEGADGRSFAIILGRHGLEPQPAINADPKDPHGPEGATVDAAVFEPALEAVSPIGDLMREMHAIPAVQQVTPKGRKSVPRPHKSARTPAKKGEALRDLTGLGRAMGMPEAVMELQV